MGVKKFLGETGKLLGLDLSSKKDRKHKKIKILVEQLENKKQKIQDILGEKGIDKKQKIELDDKIKTINCLIKNSKKL